MADYSEQEHLQKTNPELKYTYLELKKRVLDRNQDLEFYPKQRYIGVKRKGDSSRPYVLAHFHFSRNVFHFYVHFEDYKYGRTKTDSISRKNQEQIKKIVKKYEVAAPNKEHYYWYVKVTDDSGIDELLNYMSPVLGSKPSPVSATKKVNEKQKNGFSFIPGYVGTPPPTERKSPGRKTQTKGKHEKLKKHLYNKKVKEYGEKNVGTELDSGNGQFIDLVVQKRSKYWFYEVKADDNDRLCIREAIGQLLEYSYWPGCEVAERLIVAGEPKLTKDSEAYLKKLREKLKIPLFYEQITS